MRSKLDRVAVERMYCVEKKSMQEVAEFFGYSCSGIRYAFSQWGIPTRYRGEYRIKGDTRFTKEQLHQLYWEENLSLTAIANKFGCTKRYVQSRMKVFGIPRRSRAESVRLSIPTRKSCWSEERKEVAREKSRGAANPNWKGGTTRESYTHRVTEKYLEWRKRVYERDAYTCVSCGDSSGGNLCAHHVMNFSKLAGGAEEYAVYNGITFCNMCHREFHAKYGNMNNDLEQLCVFLNVAIADAEAVLGVRAVMSIVLREKNKQGPRPHEPCSDVCNVVGLEDAFWRRVDKNADCWTWLGSCDVAGHGRFAFKQKRYCAHRVAWELTVGPLAPNRNVRQTCRNRACVNPGHLELCRA